MNYYTRGLEFRSSTSEMFCPNRIERVAGGPSFKHGRDRRMFPCLTVYGWTWESGACSFITADSLFASTTR